MSEAQTGFLLGIGSNIEPDENLSKIIALLFEHFPTLYLSRILRIPPIGMNSHRDFLNTVVFVETDMAEQTLKKICNDIEIKLGRDRDDPASKMKDRPADLDILTAATFPDDKNRAASSITDEYFIYPLLDEISAYLSGSNYSSKQQGVTLTLDKLSFGQAATTIHRDASASNKRIS